ncbi:HlyD family type I secretion periplasmic adaptor subunit [Methylovulum miyakonense]|uniref:HlyD family type I secretion periplasmic adaptor subunit n=1 Tax=Methylovulum miyakonense TaxID=645578 RepID=UPI0003767850|nr:HlyD family type I secretion periplasmic adaptor subunit [Methylovulum miyakonense]
MISSDKQAIDRKKDMDINRYADDAPIRRIGYVIVILIFGFFGAWSALAPLGSAALAPGSVTVEGYRKTVQHLEGGIIKALHVRDGDTVTKGQVLIELEDTSSRAQLETLRGQLFSALAREARLTAERDGMATVSYPELLKNEIQDPRAQEAIRVQDQSFTVRKHSRNGEINILQEQRRQLSAKIEGIKAQKNSRNSLVDSLSKDLVDFRAMLKEGYMEKQKVTELERRLTEAKGDEGDFTANIATAQTQISETSLKILQIEKEFQRQVIEELSKVQTELSELREKIQWLDDTVTRTVIKAPDAGMVLGLTVHTLGAVVPPGGHLLDIVPQQEKLLIEAQVSPIDIDRVHIGQTTEIRFSAFKSAKTPKVSGRLIALSADRLSDEKKEVSYYLARVEVDQEGLKELTGRGLILLPGMPAEVLINTGDRTFLEYLMQPLSNIFARSLIED